MHSTLMSQILAHTRSRVVPMLTSSGLMQCVATVMMLAGVVFFGILIGSLEEIVPHAFNIDYQILSHARSSVISMLT